MAHARYHGKGIEARFIADIVLHGHDNDLGEIDSRATADGHDQIGLCLLCMKGDLGGLLTRRVRRNSVESCCMFVPKHTPDFLDLVGLGVQGSADDEENTRCVELLRLFLDGLRRGFAIDDAINCRKVV